MAKNTLIDNILGPNVDTTSPFIEGSNKVSLEKNISRIKLPLHKGIDTILNNCLINFENKQQSSMFFITYKCIDAIYKDLANKYNIIIPTEIIENTINLLIPNMIKEYTGNMKKRSKKIMNDDMVCIGRKLDNKQCSRKKHNGTDFCKSHLRKLSNGRMDQPINTPINRNKRGRKRKVQFDPRQYDDEYITLWEDIIDGYKVLVDNNNNVYTFNLDNPVFLGKKDINLKLDLDKINKSTPDIKIDISQGTNQSDNQNNNDYGDNGDGTFDNINPLIQEIKSYSREPIISKLNIDIEGEINKLVITEDVPLETFSIPLDDVKKIENPNITVPTSTTPTKIIKKKCNKKI